MNSEMETDKEEELQNSTAIAHQLAKEHQDLLLLIGVLQDKVKRLEGKEKVGNDGRHGGDVPLTVAQKKEWDNTDRRNQYRGGGNRRFEGYQGRQHWRRRTHPRVVAV